MSVELFRSRLQEDIRHRIDEDAALLVSRTQAPLDEMRRYQGRIETWREIHDMIEERYKNLHAIG